ncbi:hypothetical protein H7U32_04695 [Bifidobacterium pullorum subsp. saeculare]|uniref:Uncharacterized protein n=1 Tax=Bifidobacterium pullorum subsp. saeculare TaxID=78257 RepID=A0A938WXS7_9BIFI|nr:hypothetical protein [Bifidobacterium pullorum]MBM6699622.1 hypothetical protein [Bifidobacterium pullorum subsp. saeculare]
MTFNRYMFLRMWVEALGAAACLALIAVGGALEGVIVAGVVALVWAAGEVWAATVLQRRHPRRDELSDENQKQAMQFALMALVAVLVLIGFADTVAGLFSTGDVRIHPMLLPALAMAALAVADARYLWLERGDMKDDDDED